MAGLLNGFLLFLSYTFTIALMRENTFYFGQYLIAFMFGGFSLPAIGAIAPLARGNKRSPAAIAALVILVIAVCGYGYTAIPRYIYGYQVSLSKSPENIEIYLPLGVAEESYAAELLEQSEFVTDFVNTDNYSYEIVETEYGQMLKIVISERIPDLRTHASRTLGFDALIVADTFGYRGEFRSLQRHNVLQDIQLTTKLDETFPNTVNLQRFIGPIRVAESVVAAEFNIPLKIKSDTEGNVNFRFSSGIRRKETINFWYTRTEFYSERFDYNGGTSEDWQLIPATGASSISVIGIAD